MFEKIIKTIWEPFDKNDPLDYLLLVAGWITLLYLIMTTTMGG
jgi:hypothetical protein